MWQTLRSHDSPGNLFCIPPRGRSDAGTRRSDGWVDGQLWEETLEPGGRQLVPMRSQVAAERFETADDDPVGRRSSRFQHFEVVRHDDEVGPAAPAGRFERAAHFHILLAPTCAGRGLPKPSRKTDTG